MDISCIFFSETLILELFGPSKVKYNNKIADFFFVLSQNAQSAQKKEWKINFSLYNTWYV